ncbi:adenosylcobinamide-GDP ribazoletransferase [Salipiger aestuarii]|uniref:Adenosylcobinamide-GDP ribazoletransferase n=1 Tax=Salipiger aestuarii TaxID=568098 RepID=A0A327Y864_9RHOB|nr:adenosylcobinamide-GDP ribazoletransferase [Salipiger aestuarii]RAK16671.1 cobalamin-5'-phosphate synthase [Salipiger aestuarii]
MTVPARIREARVALMLLTRLPAGRFDGDVPGLDAARWAFALAGVPVAVIGWAVLAGAQALGLAPHVAGVAAVAMMALTTGGLHHDGFADMADAAGGRDRAHRLDIMRDSRVGSFGVLALVLACGLGAAALAALPADGYGLAAMALAAMASRLAMVLVLALVPPARSDGLGQAARGNTTAWVPGAIPCAGLALVLGPPGWVALVVMAATATLLARRARTTLGGQTGDVLGAVQLCAETAGWVALSATM